MDSVVQNLQLAHIRTDGGTQPRVALDEGTVSEYAEALTAGDRFPPVTVFHDGSDHWLADGFHRFHAHRAIGALDIQADVRQGTRREAILHSVGANAAHGLRRSNEDKRAAVLTVLSDEEWDQWSNREIARRCGVSDVFVAKVRESICKPFADGAQPAVRTVERAGKTYQQDTTNIGRKQPSPPPPSAPSVGAPEAPPSAAALRESFQGDAGGGRDQKAPTDDDARSDLEEECEALRAVNADLEAEIKSLRLAVDPDVAARFKDMQAQIDVISSQRDMYMNQQAEMRRQIRALERKLEARK